MTYRLGVDLGTTYTAAAYAGTGPPAMLDLGNRAQQVPSVLFFAADGQVLVGEAADRRAAAEPERVVREFKRRLGDEVPLVVAGQPMYAVDLSAILLRWVCDMAGERLGEDPAAITVTHPANWGPYKLQLMHDVVARAGLPEATLLPEPVAAAVHYAAKKAVAVGDTIVVYDLGGGTFDVAVLEKTAGGFAVLGVPEGVEHLGGSDFDEAVFAFVAARLGLGPDHLDVDDPAAARALARLRRDCVEAKEALSVDTVAEIRSEVPGAAQTVRITRSEFEGLIRPALEETVLATRRALRTAGVEPAHLRDIVLVGGSSRIPLVATVLWESFGVSIGLDAYPKNDIALGAALHAQQLGDAPTTPFAPVGPAEPQAPSPSPAPGTLRGRAIEVDDDPEQVSLPFVLAPLPEDAPPPPGPPAGPPPAGPAIPAAPTPAGHPGWRRRLPLIIAAAALIIALGVGAGVLLPRLLSGDGPVALPSPSPAPSSAEPSSPPPSPTGPDLPRSEPLPSDQFVLPQRAETDGPSRLFLGSVASPIKPERLPTPAGGDYFAPGLSPDRRTLIYIDGERDVLRAMAADGSGDRLLFGKPDGCDDIYHASWSPAELTTVVVECQTEDEPDQLLVMTLDGTVVRRLATGLARTQDPSVSPDGSSVVYWGRGVDGRTGGALFRIALDGSGEPERLTNSGPGIDADPTWSPDGGSIAFTRRVGGVKSNNLDVMLMNSDGSDVRPLVTGPAVDQKPAWSPDGTQLLIISNRDAQGEPTEEQEVWLISGDGDDQRPLGLAQPRLSTPVWWHR